jgi:hypothetical protein
MGVKVLSVTGAAKVQFYNVTLDRAGGAHRGELAR